MIGKYSRLTFRNGIFVSEVPSASNATIIDRYTDFGLQTETYKNVYALPRLTDSHIHLFGLGMRLDMLSFGENESANEVAQKSLEYSGEKRGDWIVGFGWSGVSAGLLSRKILDAYVPYSPVYLIKSDGHEVCCNSLALRIAGIESASGILRGEAKEKVYSCIPPYERSQEKKLLQNAINILRARGIGSICDFDTEIHTIEALFELDREENLSINIYLYLNYKNYRYYCAQHSDTRHIKLRGIKYYADGTLGSHSAAISMPYQDSIDQVELLQRPKMLLREMMFADNRGLDFAIHCIGDRANALVAEAAVQARRYDVTAAIRVEHCQILQDSDVMKFAEAEVVASVQPSHYIDDLKVGLLAKVLPHELMKYAYRWKYLKDKGVRMIAGSDSPVATADPAKGICAFLHGREGESLEIDDAIRCYSDEPRELLALNSPKYDDEVILYSDAKSFEIKQIIKVEK